MILSFTLLSALLLIPTQAIPYPRASHGRLDNLSRRDDSPADRVAIVPGLTEEQVLILAPKSKVCDGTGNFKDECRNATVAAKEFNKAFNKYSITSPGAKAAITSLVAFESGDFKFNVNHFPEPGRPGQGTRSMLMFNFVFEYAKDIKPTEAGNVAKKFEGREPTPEEQNEIRALVLDDESSFASAAWFFQKKCSLSVQTEVNAGTVNGWTRYIKECVNTGLDEAREKGYELARQAVGLSTAPQVA